MLTREEFDSLSEGDVVETDATMFRHLTPETIQLLVKAVSEDKNRREFVATFMGITLGKMICVINEGELTWTIS